MDTTLLQSLADKEEIRALRYRFGHGVDKRDWADLETVFADVVETDLSQFGIPAATIARSDFLAIFKHAFRNPDIRTQQLYSGFLIEVSGDQATCRSYLHGHHYQQGYPGGDVFEIRAEYVDELTRTSAGWRITKVTLNVISVIGNTALVA